MHLMKYENILYIFLLSTCKFYAINETKGDFVYSIPFKLNAVLILNFIGKLNDVLYFSV